MRFRHIYWVTEQLASSGASTVAGVYSSVHDLAERGVQWMEGIEARAGFRLTLVQVDCDRPPLGTWTSPDFSGLESDLQEFVKTDELSHSEVEGLASELRAFFR